MNNFHIESYRYKTVPIFAFMSTQVCAVRISTVQLPGDYGYETCIFYRGGDSEVVETYAAKDEAILGHHRWMHEYRLTNLKVKV